MKKILSMLTASTLATAMLATQVSAEYAGNFSFATKTDSIPGTKVTIDEEMSTSGTLLATEGDFGPDATCIQIQSVSVGGNFEFVPTDVVTVTAEAANDENTSAWNLAFNCYDSTWGGWSGPYSDAGVLEFSATIQEMMDSISVTDVEQFGGFIFQVWNCQVGDEINWTLSIAPGSDTPVEPDVPDEPVPDEPVPEEPDEPVEPVEKDIDLLSSGSTYVDSETVRTDIYNEWSTNSDGIIVNSDDFVNVGSISVRIAVSDVRTPFNAWLGYADSNWEYMYWGEDDEGNYGTSSDKIIVNGDGYYVINLSIDGYPSGLAFMTVYTNLYAEDESDIPSITIDAIRINGVLEDTDGDSYDPDIYFSYAELDDGTVEITGYSGADEEVIIPSEIDGKKVTRIGEVAFYSNNNITTVVIPDSVTSIGEKAFAFCSSLTSVEIPETVTVIEEQAFLWCEVLSEITIPENVTRIGKQAFSDCSALVSINVDKDNKYFSSEDDVLFNKDKTILIQYPEGKTATTYTIPDSVTSIEDYAFLRCTSLASVTIPDSVTSIGSYAFELCKSLVSVDVPNSVTSIGEGAFMQCNSLTSITIPNSITSIGRHTFYNCSSLTSVTIPDSVTSIGDSVFEGCTSLTSVTIPDGITVISDNAFYGCFSLASVDIPDSVTSIGCSAFRGCKSLECVNIPDGITSIGESTFYGCSSLVSITIPDSVTSIGFYAFYGCTSLTSITIPDSVTSVDKWAFSGCTSLTSITIPDSITSIEYEAFSGCTSLVSVIIPDSVTSIDDYAFTDCDNLVISCYENSVAHKYAVDNNIKYELISKVTAPTAVKGLSLGGRSGNALRLNWTKNTSADGYIIEMYKGGKWTRIARIAGNSTTTYRVTGLAAGTAYKFRMKAYKMDGTKALYSEYTSTFAARTNPSVVTGLKIGGRASNALRLNWTKNTSADGYIVEMYKGGKWVRVARIASNATTTYRVSGLAASTQYKFRVKAYKMSGKTALYSGYTSTLAAYTNPSAVSNLKITGKAGTALRLGWSKNTSADGYIVEMYSGGKWVRVAKITSNATVTYRKAGLKKGTTYKFRVATYNVAGGTAYYGAYVNVSGTTNK